MCLILNMVLGTILIKDRRGILNRILSKRYNIYYIIIVVVLNLKTVIETFDTVSFVNLFLSFA